jgi:hypothetical protein
MADTVLDQIVDNLRNSATDLFPQHSKLRSVRVVGHSPKAGYCTYEIVLDFADGRERVSAKIYRPGKSGPPAARERASREAANLGRIAEAAMRHRLTGVPRPIGSFAELGAVVSDRLSGLPLQSVLMKAALLPASASNAGLDLAARRTGEWLRRFHDATAGNPQALDREALFSEIEGLCAKGQQDGLAKASVQSILEYVGAALASVRKPLPSSAVLNEFVPLNVLISNRGIAYGEFANLSLQGPALHDVATFLAAVEALEKYPFCDRSLTSRVHDCFLPAYGMDASEEQLLTVFKLRELLQMFVQGRAAKDGALRKKIMWSNVMKRFIQTAAERSMAPAA